VRVVLRDDGEPVQFAAHQGRLHGAQLDQQVDLAVALGEGARERPDAIQEALGTVDFSQWASLVNIVLPDSHATLAQE
jgi:hypothetical protein